MMDHTDITWFHSIDLGNSVVTKGHKSPELLEAEFDRLQLTGEELRGKRVLDIGCNDGFMSLKCEGLGADVTGIDGIFRDGLRCVREHLKPRFHFYVIDVMSPSFHELGRFDVILYLGVLYHTMYPFEQLVRVASACNPGATLLLESEYYDLPGFEQEATIVFNYQGKVVSDPCSPVFPSITWIEQTLGRIGFGRVTLLHRVGGRQRGRVTVRAQYSGGSTVSPFLYAGEQVHV
jgi:tRNA (mo5U34)-methyltransferase